MPYVLDVYRGGDTLLELIDEDNWFTLEYIIFRAYIARVYNPNLSGSIEVFKFIAAN